MGLEPRQPAQCADPLLGARSARQWVLPRYPPFLERRGDIHHPALGISPPFAAPHLPQGCGGGGGWRHARVASACKPLPRKPLSPIPELIGAGDLTQAKVYPCKYQVAPWYLYER